MERRGQRHMPKVTTNIIGQYTRMHVEDYLAIRLGGDRTFTAMIGKNPMELWTVNYIGRLI